MKKILLIAFVIIVTSLSLHINAQTNAHPAETVPRTTDIDLQSKVDNLTAQVDSLSHELNYMKLSNHFYTLNNDLQLLILDIQNEIYNMQIDIYRNSLDRRSYYVYDNSYDLSKQKFDSYKNLRKSIQKLYSVNCLADKFTNDEKEILDLADDMTSNLIIKAELELDTMKELLGIYYNNL